MRVHLMVLLTMAAGTPAAAFDCNKATTPSEKAICADPAARSADAALGKAYASLLGSSSVAQRAAISGAQARWLKTRDSACADQKGPALSTCLATQSDERRAFLIAQPLAGPGAPDRLAPWFRFEKGAKGKAEVNLELIKFAEAKTPAEHAFNAAVDAAYGEITQPGKDDPAADRYAYDWTMRLVYASPRLVSAEVSGFFDTGGAHPNSTLFNINVDLAADRIARFPDAFDAKAAAKLVALCKAAVLTTKQARLGADGMPKGDELKQFDKDIDAATRDLSAWSFNADKAVVSYAPYTLGAYAEGGYSCEIPYATLRSLTRPEFPLPQ